MSTFANPGPRAPAATRGFVASADRPMSLLRRCPVYRASPLLDMPRLASRLGAARLWVKDETARMRLGAFKALGGVFAVAQTIREAAGVDDPDAPEARAGAARMTFVTASAGNHGLSVAAGARIFGARSAIVLDAAVPESFAERIRAAGGEVERVAGAYEDAVAHARALAADRGWLLLADGSWEGYVAAPALVMEGYATLAEECRASFAAAGEWPDRVLLQAGVGGMAAAVAAHVRDRWPVQPEITVVEPDRAACLQASMRAGRPTRAGGGPSVMGRLDCKDASLLAFEALRADADRFATVTEAEAEAAVALFARHGVRTTPSGAATLAALTADPPGAGARCLIVATEGVEPGAAP